MRTAVPEILRLRCPPEIRHDIVCTNSIIVRDQVQSRWLGPQKCQGHQSMNVDSLLIECAERQTDR